VKAMPVDTADQVVCTVGQTDGHSSPDHTTSQADIKWNSLGPQATLNKGQESYFYIYTQIVYPSIRTTNNNNNNNNNNKK